MKKIIDGKLYNTETATEVAVWSNGPDYRDFHHVAETLFRKRTGEYFLHGSGGPMSRYAVSCGQNSWGGGEKIIPLSFENAREWAEEHMDADDYQAEFGDVSEGDSADRAVLSVSLDAAVADRIRREAQERGLSISALIASKF